MIASAALGQQVDGAPAIPGAAQTRDALDVFGKTIIDGQLFAPPYRPLTHVENMLLEVPGTQVRIATMVDDFGPAAAERSVERPVIIEREEIGDVAIPAPFGFPAADLFAGVLNDLATRWNWL